MFPIGSYQRLLQYKVQHWKHCMFSQTQDSLPVILRSRMSPVWHSAYSLKLTAKTLRWLCEAISFVVTVLIEKAALQSKYLTLNVRTFSSVVLDIMKKWWFITEALVPGLILTRALLRQCYQECALLNWFCSMLFSICILKLLSRDSFSQKWWERKE